MTAVLIFWILLFLLNPGMLILPVVASSGFFATMKSIVYSGYSSVRCKVGTCCDDYMIIKDFAGLENDLSSKLHGQHLVQKAVIGHLRGHLMSHNSPKALVLSFHGPTGVGKNFVSKIIAENVYRDGIKSPFVHLISATREFPHEGLVPVYKDQLKSWIEGNMTNCDQSMFIFDEVDKLPGKLLDVLKPYLDYYEHLGEVNYRRAIFIFLSNTGGTDISKLVFERWKSGKGRETLQLREVENSLMSDAINTETQGGLWHSQLISSHLITAYIPFLPLEKEHVRKCIQDYLKERYSSQISGNRDKIVDEVIKEMLFYPATEQLFSSTGCKRVVEKVDYVMLDSDSQTSWSQNRNSEL